MLSFFFTILKSCNQPKSCQLLALLVYSFACVGFLSESFAGEGPRSSTGESWSVLKSFDDEENSSSVRIVGKVIRAPKAPKKNSSKPKKTAEEVLAVPVVIRGAAGKFELASLETATWFQHQTLYLRAIAKGKPIWVLARSQEATTGYEPGQDLGPQIVQVQCIVQGDFRPPVLSKQQRLAHLQWLSGSLGITEKGNKFWLGKIALQAGSKKQVLVIKPVKAGSVRIRKNSVVRVVSRVSPATASSLSKKDRKLRKVQVSRIDLLDPKFSGMKLILGKN